MLAILLSQCLVQIPTPRCVSRMYVCVRVRVHVRVRVVSRREIDCLPDFRLQSIRFLFSRWSQQRDDDDVAQAGIGVLVESLSAPSPSRRPFPGGRTRPARGCALALEIYDIRDFYIECSSGAESGAGSSRLPSGLAAALICGADTSHGALIDSCLPDPSIHRIVQQANTSTQPRSKNVSRVRTTQCAL